MKEWMIPLCIAAATGLLYLGIWLGQLRASTRSAHHRIDGLEENLATQFSELRGTLERVMREAWRSCPAAGVAHELAKQAKGGGP